MYEFTEDCMIHIPQIDEEHRKLFQMINDALSLVKTTEDISGIAQSLLLHLKDYANTHFAHEEAYMEQIHDPELPLQKKEHAEFAEKINSFILDKSSKEAARASFEELLSYLVRWLYHHILSSDMMIGKMSAVEGTSEDPFAFTDKYKTGIDLVDKEHRRLFEIIKETNDLIQNDLLHDKYDEIMRLLVDLKDYTQFHFADEEMLMEKIHYPELAAQKRAHTVFVERLVEIDLSELDDMDNNQQTYLLELIQFLLGWLSNHIIGMDKKIAVYMDEMKK